MNQYRCETCKTMSCENNPENPDAYYLRDRQEKRFYVGVQDVHEFTGKYGCASHSDFQSDRGNVLDEATIIVTKEIKEQDNAPTRINTPEFDDGVLAGKYIHSRDMGEQLQELRQSKQVGE
jgi:hypothetical protein